MNVKYRLAIAVCAFIFSSTLWGHTLLLAVNLNEDDTVTVEGLFSSGSPASGLEIRLEAADGRIIATKHADADGIATFEKPDEPYYIVMDGGEGHVVEEEGPN